MHLEGISVSVVKEETMEQQVVREENKMGVMPIPKLLFSMSAPMILSMLVQACYNVVDGLFVAQDSADGFNALSMSFSIQMLMIAVGAGTGVGINALLSRNLGEKKFEDANKAAVNGIFLGICSCLVFAIFGIFGSHTFFATQTQNQAIINSGTSYLTICTVGSLGIFMQIIMERLLQSTGNSFYCMFTQGTGAIINIILDPILIFGYFGFPRMGVTGAAIATVVGQLVAMSMGIYFNLKKNPQITISFKGFKPDKRTIRNIYVVGVPAIIMQAIGSVMYYGMNCIFAGYSSVSTVLSEGAVFVFGAYFKLQSFIFMPVIGLNNGMIPILAYNYGARNKKRIIKTIKLSIATAVTMMLVGFLIFQLFSQQLLQVFNATDEIMRIGVPAFRTISFSFIFGGFCIILLSVFQALGSGFLSLIVSVARQLIVILPSAYLFMTYMGLDKVWYAFPLAEIVSVILSMIFFKYLYHKKIEPIKEK